MCFWGEALVLGLNINLPAGRCHRACLRRHPRGSALGVFLPYARMMGNGRNLPIDLAVNKASIKAVGR
jgi:hypothetical protein